jgi:hypothetical protein
MHEKWSSAPAMKLFLLLCLSCCTGGSGIVRYDVSIDVDRFLNWIPCTGTCTKKTKWNVTSRGPATYGTGGSDTWTIWVVTYGFAANTWSQQFHILTNRETKQEENDFLGRPLSGMRPTFVVRQQGPVYWHKDSSKPSLSAICVLYCSLSWFLLRFNFKTPLKSH